MTGLGQDGWGVDAACGDIVATATSSAGTPESHLLSGSQGAPLFTLIAPCDLTSFLVTIILRAIICFSSRCSSETQF